MLECMAIEPLTHVQLFTTGEHWRASVSSPRGMLLVGISDDAQGRHDRAFLELATHLREVYALGGPLKWVETSPGVWTATLP